jgi:polar amino acid transport system substrate-binding protein
VVFTVHCGVGRSAAAATPLLEPEAGVSIGTGERLQGICVLVVDDNELNRHIAAALLRRAGAVAMHAENGCQALEVLAEGHEIDLVLMDLQMPVMDGYEALKEIRRDPRWRNLPVIAVTASAMVQERERCMAAGMNTVLTKPFYPAAFYAALAPWTLDRRRRRTPGAPPSRRN